MLHSAGFLWCDWTLHNFTWIPSELSNVNTISFLNAVSRLQLISLMLVSCTQINFWKNQFSDFRGLSCLESIYDIETWVVTTYNQYVVVSTEAGGHDLEDHANGFHYIKIMDDLVWLTSLFLVKRDVTTGRTNPTAHDTKIEVFVKVSDEEVLPNFIISPSETLMWSQKTWMVKFKDTVVSLCEGSYQYRSKMN